MSERTSVQEPVIEDQKNAQKPEWTDAQKTAIGSEIKLILVSAAAGSGKTAVLTERVIRRILDPKYNLKLSDLLIVTFTRAAAAELKSKIAKAIENEIAKEDLDPQSRQKLQDQLLQLGGAQISTIDSFYLQIVRAHFERLGLPANFRLADENELRVLADEILDDLIPEFYNRYLPENTEDTAADPFAKVRNNPFADCVDHIFNGTSSGSLNNVFLDFYQSFSRIKGGINALREAANTLRAESELPFLQTRFGAAFLSRFEPFVQSFYSVLEDVKEENQTDPENAKKNEGVIADEMYFCKSILLSISEKNWDSLQKTIFAFSFRKLSEVKGKPKWPKKYSKGRNKFKDEIEKYKLLVNAITTVEQKKAFLKTAEFAEMLYAFYSEFQTRYQSEKLARGIQDFNDVRDSLSQLLSNPENVSLVESICSTYKEVYIDEYQDVDEIQDEIFAKIGTNGRFMVGDIKQSIYGFRGSDPSVFSGYRNTMPLVTSPDEKGLASGCVFMSDNFRCDRPIIDLANTVCSFLFSASPQSIHYLPEDDLKCSKKAKNGVSFDPAPVTIRIFEKPSKSNGKDSAEESEDAEKGGEAERRWIIQEIARLLREGKKDDGSNIKPEEIAVLARKKDSLGQIQKELEASGIPVLNVGGNSISRSPLLIDLLNLLRAVDNPYRDLPLSEYLLSGFGGFTLEEIRLLRSDFSIEKSLYDALVSAATANHPLAGKAAGFIDWLDEYRRLSTSLSADHFLRILYQDQKFNAYAFSPEFLTLYEQARTYQQTSWAGLYGFLNYIDRLTQADKLESGFRKAESAVNLMTIHASKGLEYPVVFLVDCGRSIQKDSHKKRLIFRKEIGFASDLYEEESEYSKPSFLKNIADFAAKDAEIEEEVRLLYVAMTRAREKLYLTATPTRKLDNFFSDVSMIRRDDRYSILSATSYIDWICGALPNPTAIPQIVDYSEIPFSPASENEEPTNEPTLPTVPENPPIEPDPTAKHYQSVLEKAQDYPYPLRALQGIPTKAAASKLKENLLDLLKGADEAKAISERLTLMRDAQPEFADLLEAQRKPTAAQIGSATHAFLALSDPKNLSPETVEDELQRLVDQKFLSRETANIVNLRVLKRFAESQLLKKMQTAKEIYREQQFSLFVPLSELTQDPALAASLSGHELFVQGSIDLLLITEEGKIELYDYKTDRITEEERKDPALLREHLKTRHGNQLQFYARAVEELFGARPDRISIFALSVGEIVDLF